MFFQCFALFDVAYRQQTRTVFYALNANYFCNSEVANSANHHIING